MTPEQFTFWLHGVAAIKGGEVPTRKEWDRVLAFLQTATSVPIHEYPVEPDPEIEPGPEDRPETAEQGWTMPLRETA